MHCPRIVARQRPTAFLMRWVRRWTYMPQHASGEHKKPEERTRGPAPIVRDPVTGLYV